jgi:hypothetical protein
MFLNGVGVMRVYALIFTVVCLGFSLNSRAESPKDTVITGALKRVTELNNKNEKTIVYAVEEVDLDGKHLPKKRFLKLKFKKGVPASLKELSDNSLIRIHGLENEKKELSPGDSAGDVVVIAPLEEQSWAPVLLLKNIAFSQMTAEAAVLGLPELSSLPGASATLHLDFDGHVTGNWGGYTNVSTPAFDQDGDPTSFSSGEASAIHEVWRRVAEDYAPFGVNVTTVDPGNLREGVTAKIAIGGSYSDWYGSSAGGVAYVGGFYSSAPNVAFAFAINLGNHPKYMAEAAAHEAGHLFGLRHQGCNGAAYCSDLGMGKAPVMGVGYYQARTIWWNVAQDDLSVLSGQSNGFGYRSDDRADTAGAATPLVVAADGISVSQSGLISSMTDTDYFSFTSGSGPVQLNLAMESGITNLDAVLELRDSSGSNVIAVSDLYPSLSVNLASGSYRILVRSRGNYGDLGQYQIGGTIQPWDGISAPTNLVAVGRSSSEIELSWTESNSSETSLEVHRSSNGVDWYLLAILSPNTLGYFDTGLAPGSVFSYAVRAVRNSSYSDFSNRVAMSTTPSTPSGLMAEGISSSRIHLSWLDVDGESEFRIERSQNGINFSPLGVVAADVVSFEDSGLAPMTTYYYRVTAYNGGGASSSSDVASGITLEGAPAPAAPSVLVASVISAKEIYLSWQDNASSETSFTLQRSTNKGKSWAVVSNLPANTVFYFDKSVAAGKTYWYRVSAGNEGGSSAFSNTAVALTPRR